MTYYPPAGFHFRVEFDLNDLGPRDMNFQEVSGLKAVIETEPVKEGGENRFIHRLATRAKYEDLVLKRGMLTDSELIEWFSKAVESLIIDPVTVNVFLLNSNSEPTAGWTFLKAWPSTWDVSSFNAEGNDLVVETINLSYQYFRRL